MVDTSDPPRVKVRTFSNGKQQEPLFHPLTLGLLCRDPPQQTSSEISLENEARERAKKGLDKAWEDSLEQVKEAERKLLNVQYSNLVAPGTHKGRVDLVSGRIEPYIVTDLPSKRDIERENTFLSNDRACIRRAYSEMKSASSTRLSAKINYFVDRFMFIISSSVPLTRQRDLDERSYNILSFGLDRPKPEAFFMPSSYLCFSIHLEDVRLHEDNTV